MRKPDAGEGGEGGRVVGARPRDAPVAGKVRCGGGRDVLGDAQQPARRYRVLGDAALYRRSRSQTGLAVSSLALRARYYSGGALPGGTRGGIERATARQQAGDISSAVARSQPEPTPPAIATPPPRVFRLNGFIPPNRQ